MREWNGVDVLEITLTSLQQRLRTSTFYGLLLLCGLSKLADLIAVTSLGCLGQLNALFVYYISKSTKANSVTGMSLSICNKCDAR